MEFDDRAAHQMALLAMEQFGAAICSLEPALVPAASLPQLRNSPARGPNARVDGDENGARRGGFVPVIVGCHVRQPCRMASATLLETGDAGETWRAVRR